MRGERQATQHPNSTKHSPKERNGRPASKVREHQQRHPLRHSQVGVRGHGVVAADGEVHGGVAGGDDEEGEAVDQQQRHQIRQGEPVTGFHR